MVRTRSLIGLIARAPVLRNPFQRRIVAAILLVVCGVLTFYPQKYRAAASLTPVDPASLGIAGAVGGLSIGSILSSQMSVETNLEMARSQYVREDVAKRLNLAKRLHKDPIKVDRWLYDKVGVNAVRGGAIEFEARLTDPILARDLVAAFAASTRDWIAKVLRNQTDYKRKIVEELLQQSGGKLDIARSAYDDFRLHTRYSSPQMALSAAGAQVPQIRAAIRATEIRLSTARRFGTDQNLDVQRLKADLAALRQQLADAQSLTPTGQDSVQKVVSESTELEKLKRNLLLNQGFYDNYKRIMQNTTAEYLTAIANIKIIEPAYIDTARQYNLLPMISGLFIFLVVIAIEAYVLFPPVEARRQSS